MLIKTGINAVFINLHKLGHSMLRAYWVFGLCPSSSILKNITLHKMNLLPSSHEKVGGTYSVEPVRKS
jgi:hypothetical protein